MPGRDGAGLAVPVGGGGGRRNLFAARAWPGLSGDGVVVVKKVVLNALNHVPVFLIVTGEALFMYAATLVAKLAFIQLDPLYAVWYRVGFTALLLIAWRLQSVVLAVPAVRHTVAPKPGAIWAVGAQGAAKLLASRW